MTAFNVKKNGDLLFDEDIQEAYPVILRTVTGSRLYGTQYEKGENPIDPDYVSDFDYRGIYVAKVSDFLKFDQKPKTVAKVVDGDDEEYYELRKFCMMALECNPNIMDILFSDEESILEKSPVISTLIDNRDAFLSIKAKDSFCGYAQSQLLRMQNHRKFLVDFPDVLRVRGALQSAFDKKEIDFQWIADKFSGDLAKQVSGETAEKHKVLDHYIELEDFESKYFSDKPKGFIERYAKPHILNYMNVIDKEMVGLSKEKGKEILEGFKNGGTYEAIKGGMLKLYKTGRGIFHNAGTLIRRPSEPVKGERTVAYATVDSTKYKSDLKRVGDLWSWCVGRNEKRAILEENFGYDTKHAMHLYRLMIGAEKLVSEGNYSPRLSGVDLEEVKKIREGRYSYDQVLNLAKRKDEEVKRIVDEGKSKLPERPDKDLVFDMMMDIYKKSEGLKNVLNVRNGARKSKGLR